MTPPYRSAFPRRFLLWALLLGISGATAACQHAAIKASPTGGEGSDPCGSMEAVLRGAATSACTPAQRICLLVGDAPAAVAAPDFVPEAGYAARWQSHVQRWRTLLDELTKQPELESYVHAALRKIELLSGSERDRRLIVENGDLLHALQVLTEKAATLLPGPGLGCSPPANP